MVAISGFYLGLYGLSKVLSAVFSSPKKEVGKSAPPSPVCSYKEGVFSTCAVGVLLPRVHIFFSLLQSNKAVCMRNEILCSPTYSVQGGIEDVEAFFYYSSVSVVKYT